MLWYLLLWAPKMDDNIEGRSSNHKWLLLILILAFITRLYGLSAPPWDYHNWRQTVTLMVARNFARHGFALLHPQVLWIAHTQPSDPSYFSAEFSFQSVIAAFMYKLFGESEAIPRLVVIAFSLSGIYFLYRLVRRHAGPLAACLAAFIYSMLPFHLFFGRVFMPDVPALSLAIGALDFLDRWVDYPNWRMLIGAAVLAALALLQKLTVAFIALPALYLFWLVYGKHLVVRLQPYVFATVTFLPSIIWYGHAMSLARQSGFAMQPYRVGSHLELWSNASFLRQVQSALVEAFSPIGLLLVVLGVFWNAGGRTVWICRLWLAGAGATLILIPELLPENHYYLSLLLPGAAGLAALGLTRLTPNRYAYLLLAIVLVLYSVGAVYSATPFYIADRWPWELGRLLNSLTAPNDLIITESGGSPNILYYADRRGWMLSRTYDLAFIERLVTAGARYYAALDTDDQPDFLRAMDARYERILPPREHSGWHIYRLAP